MKATEVHHSTETLKRTTTREPLPRYDSNGEANPSPPPTAQAAGPEPIPVTARIAYRDQLWKKGTLVLVGEDDSFVVGAIDEALTTETIHSNPRREPEELHLRPDQELTFVPSASDETGDELPPLQVHRRRTVVRIRPDTAARYGSLYKLLTAAETTPRAVGRDLSRLTWTHVYGSIEATKRAERVLQRAKRLVE